MRKFKALDVYSSISIEGGDARPYYDESANVDVGMDVIADRSNISEAFMRRVAQIVGLLVKQNVAYNASIEDGVIVMIEDTDPKILADALITIDAADFLDESDCLSFLREYADYMPKSFELTGSVDIEGFEEID
jgi:hypothetical protein